MGGLIIDVLIAFVVKTLLRFRRTWGSGRWKLVTARIDALRVGGGWVWNCPTTEITYTYDFAGTAYSNVDSEPFLIGSSAQAWVEAFSPNKTILVRVNPDEPQKSVLRWSDQ